MKPLAWIAIGLFVAVLGEGGAARAQGAEVEFRRDVLAVLSKAGCNQGACHGNLNGKGGFKLSLRGEDPAADHRALVQGERGRRVNLVEPEQSLLLQKATAVAPHQGGRRFTSGDPEYRLLAAWLAAGARDRADPALRVERLEIEPQAEIRTAPQWGVSLRVTAVFAGGERRDVTRLTVFEPSLPQARVTPGGEVSVESPANLVVQARYLNGLAVARLDFVPARPDFVWPNPPEANFVDRLAFARLRELRIAPSDLADDATFLRRAHLDVLGVLPSAAEAEAFLTDADPRKRERLAERLVERPEFADRFAQLWCDLLRVEERTLDRKGVENFHHWIRQAVAENVPVDRFVRELLTGHGSTYGSPASNFHRALREPAEAAEATAQIFLGVRLQCAKCHNHPFDHWSQDDYYGFSAWFSRVRYRVLENRRLDKFDSREFDGEQIVWLARSGELVHPRTGQPAAPRFLGGPDVRLAADGDRLEALAAWLAAAENRPFARVQANRVWQALLGRGLVDPSDDFRPSNPAANEPLLEALAEEFASQGFDLKRLVRTILGSRTYQLSSEPNATNADDETLFSRAIVRRLPAEALLDAYSDVVGARPKFNGFPRGLRAGQLPGVQAIRARDAVMSAADRFLREFGKPSRQLSCDCERTAEPTVAQVFQLVSGPVVSELMQASGNRLDRWQREAVASPEIVEELFLAAFSRRPSAAERERLAAHVDAAADRRAAIEDVVWAVLNAKEFLLRR